MSMNLQVPYQVFENHNFLQSGTLKTLTSVNYLVNKQSSKGYTEMNKLFFFVHRFFKYLAKTIVQVSYNKNSDEKERRKC